MAVGNGGLRLPLGAAGVRLVEVDGAERAGVVVIGADPAFTSPKRVPAFHLQLDPPPEGDASVAEVLAACSAMQYGRDAGAVEGDRAALLERIEGLATTEGSGRANTDPENGRLPPASAGSITTPGTEPPPRARNEGRPRNSSGAIPPDSAGAAEPGATSSETDGESGAEREGGA